MRGLGWGLSLCLWVGCSGNCDITTQSLTTTFDPDARMDRAAQMRLTAGGFDALGAVVEGWVLDQSPLSFDVAGSPVVLAIDAVVLSPQSPNVLSATVDVRATGSIPDSCVAVLDGNPVQAQIEVALVPSLEDRISFEVVALSIPVTGTCVTPAVVAQLEAAAQAPLVAALGRAVGQRCDAPSSCPAGATCTADNYCAEPGSGRILPPGLDLDEHVTMPPLLELYGTPPTESEFSLRIGGTIDVDATGATLGVATGLELLTPNPRCATVLPNPRLRSGFVPAQPLPASDLADLDFDGTPETPYEVALGLSRPAFEQAVWNVYAGGLLCGAISTSDFDDLHTETLELIIPSIRFLTRAHLFERQHRPARISFWLLQEPSITIGTGEAHDVGGQLQFEEPLLTLGLHDVEVNISALVEGRWVRVMTATFDVDIGIQLMVTPGGLIEPLLGVGVSEVITNVRITNSELLSESPEALAEALPTLLSFALLEFAGSAGQFPLPSLEGTTLDILGIRGESGENVAVYADFDFGQNNLSLAAETRATLVAVHLPETQAFSVTEGAVLPVVEIALDAGQQDLEYQVRVDDGFWSPFVTGERVEVSRPEFLVQGLHRVDVRARVRGAYETLDPTPAAFEVWIDTEAPVIEQVHGEVRTWDRVSQVTLEEIEREGERIAVAIDEAGNRSELVLEPAPPVREEIATGCSATGGDPSWLLLLLLALRTPAWLRARARCRTSRRS